MYKKAFELSYKNKKVEIEIQDFTGTVRNINGTEDLFSLSYISDSKDKGQSILVTEADINFYADDYFNIDELKTVGETDIKVKYYEDDALLWSGFVIPDFFSTSVDIAPVVSMVATDRIGTLKEISNNAESNIPIQILASCLKQTGQDLPINIIADNNHFEIPVQLERIEEIASYDVIRSFMVLFNCKITLYKNAWWIINKKLLESGFINYKSYNSDGAGGSVTPFAQPILDIDLVDRGGQREIKPTSSEISLFLEFGGSKKYPKNWDFEKWNGSSFNDWTAKNVFIPKVNTKQITGYTFANNYYKAIFGADIERKSLHIKQTGGTGTIGNYYTRSHYQSSFEKIPFNEDGAIITVQANITTPSGKGLRVVPFIKIPNRNPSESEYYAISKDGSVSKVGTGSSIDLSKIKPISINNSVDDSAPTDAIEFSWSEDFKIIPSQLNVGRSLNAEASILIFEGRIDSLNANDADIFIHSIQLIFNKNEQAGKGLIFKTKQGGEKFSKSREPETILFSDKINQGVNGYFYNYKYDDTSIVDLPSEFALTSVRERADMFSKARDFYSLDGDFIVNPLAKYKCGPKSFVLVGGENRREDASIVIEEIVSNTLNKTDFIYTYFDDGKDKVKSIGTASGGSSSGGGGSSPSTPQLIKEDEEGNYYSEQPFYSLGGLSAFGFSEVGDGNGGGGGIVDLSNYYTKVETYTKTEVDSLIDGVDVGDIDLSNYYTKVETYTKTEVDSLIDGVSVPQLIKEDEEGNYYSEQPFYSLGGLSAFGFSEVGDDTGGGGIINVIDSLTSTSKTDPLSANMGRYLKTLIDNIEVGEGGIVNILPSWANYTTDKSGWALSAGLGVDLNTRKADKTWVESLLEDYVPTDTKYTAGRGLTLTGTQFSTSFDIANYATVTALGGKVDKVTGKSLISDTEIARLANVTNQDISGKADKATSLAGYGITDAYTKTNVNDLLSGKENAFTKNSAFNKNFGTIAGTVAQGNDSRILNGQTAFGWGDFRDYGLGTINREYENGSINDLYGGRSGFYYGSSTMADVPSGQYSTILHIGLNANINNQISMGRTGETWVRGMVSNNLGWGDWRRVWDSNNHRSNSENDTRYKEPFDAFKTTFDTMFRKTPTNEIEAKLSLYTLGGLSAYGFSDEGSSGGGGGIVNILSDWTKYDASKSGWALSAGLGVDLNTRKADKTWVESLLEDYVPTDTTYTAGRGLTLTGTVFSTSFDIANYATVTALGEKVDKVTGKSLIPDVEITRLAGVTNQTRASLNITNVDNTSDANKPISSATQTALNSKLATSIFNTHNTDNIRHITGAERTKWDGAFNRGDFRDYGLGNTPAKRLNDLGAVNEDINTLPRAVNAFIFPDSTALNVPGVSNDFPIGLRMSYNLNIGATLLFGRGGNDKMWFRNDRNGVGNFNPWREVWHDGNLISLSQLTDNIGVATHIANMTNPHGVTTAQIGAVDLTSNQTIGGVKSFTSNAKFTTIEASGTLTALGGNSTNWNSAFAHISVKTNPHDVTKAQVGLGNVTNESKSTMFTNPTFTGTTKVTILELDSNWKVLKTGDELEFQYNNVKKATLTPNGDLIVMGGMTAYQ